MVVNGGEPIMIKTYIVPAPDLDAAKAVYRELLGTEPYADAPFYVGFRVGDQEIGLDPHGHRDGPVGYHHVPDVAAAHKALLAAGAQPHQDITDVGGGQLIAVVKDPAGNLIGLREEK